MNQGKNVATEHLLYRICFTLTVLCTLWVSWRFVQIYVCQPYINLDRNIDWGYLNGGLAKIHSFYDTLSWWHGTWCGQVPFWRPITSYVFWIMRLLWQPEFFLPRQIVFIALHLGFIAMAWRFLFVLTKRPWLSMFTILWFTGFCSGSKPSMIMFNTLDDPKNLPEPLTGLFILGSLLLIMRGKWIGGLFLAACAVACKELGFVVWPLAVLVLGWKYLQESGANPLIGLRKRIRANALPVICWAGVLIGLGVLHYISVGIGYRMGTNQYWWRKALNYFCGPVLLGLMSINGGLHVAAIGIVISLKARTKSLLLKSACILIALGCGIAVDSYLQNTDIVIAAVRVLELERSTVIFQAVWILVGLWALRDIRTVLLGLLCCLIAAAPAWLATQTTIHTHYVAQLFMSLAVVATWAQLFLHIRKTIRPAYSDCTPLRLPAKVHRRK
jgi:hypothetical protein